MATRTDYGKLLTLPEVAERTSMSLDTIRRWASQRRIPTVRLSNRVFMTELDLHRFIEARRCEPNRTIEV